MSPQIPTISQSAYSPSPLLSQFVDFIWVGKAPKLELSTRHHAPLFTELIFNYGDHFQVEGQHVAQDGHQILSGLKTEPFQTSVAGTYGSVGLMLKPFCYGMLIEKMGTAALEEVSSILYDLLFDCQTPEMKRVESHLLALFSRLPLDPVLDTFERYVSTAPYQKGRIKDFSASLPLSQKSFIAKFKRYYCITPGSYLNLIRVNTAIRFLQQNTSSTLTEIGLASGFYDQSHFIRTFKRYCGHTPKEHVKQVQG